MLITHESGIGQGYLDSRPWLMANPQLCDVVSHVDLESAGLTGMVLLG